MTRSLLMVLLLLNGCSSSIPRIVELDEIPAEKVAEIDALPELARKPSEADQDLGMVEGISCNRRASKEPASWEDAVRRTKFRAMQMGANAIADLSCEQPKVGPLLSRITGYLMATCNETIRCTANAVRK